MEYLNYVNQASYWWIPMVVLIFTTLLSMLMGAWNGWKTALFFMSFNIVGLIIAFFTMDVYLKIIDERVSYVSLENGGIPVALAELGVFFAFGFGMTLLADIFYWFFRKKLKKKIKENKAKGKSNWASRLIGSGIGLVASLPVAVPLAAMTTVMTSNKTMTDIVNGMTKVITFGKTSGVSSEEKEVAFALMNDDVRDILVSIGDENAMKNLQAKYDSGDKAILDAKVRLERALATGSVSTLLKSIPPLLDEVSESIGKSTPTDFITKLGNGAPGFKIQIKFSVLEGLRHTFEEIVLKPDAIATNENKDGKFTDAQWGQFTSRIFDISA